MVIYISWYPACSAAHPPHQTGVVGHGYLQPPAHGEGGGVGEDRNHAAAGLSTCLMIPPNGQDNTEF